MATPVPTFKVHAHRETGGKQAGTDCILYVQAASGDFASLAAVINANAGSVPGPGTLAISSVQNVEPGGVVIA